MLAVGMLLWGCRGGRGIRDWALAFGEEEEGLNAKIAKIAKGSKG